MESDVVLYMKPATPSAVASVIHDQKLEQFFQHGGLRTVLCAYAMHAVTSRWLGYSTLNNKIPLFVDEVATHNKDLGWTDINNFEDVCQTAEYLGKAMGMYKICFLIEIKTKFVLAKIHCISDIESIEKVTHTQDPTDLLPLHVIPKHTEQTIRKAIGEDQEAFIQDMVSFAMVNFSENENIKRFTH